MTRAASVWTLLIPLVAFDVGCRKGTEAITGPSSGSQPNTPALSGALVFPASPIPLDAIEFVVPIGNLNPPDHTLPTDHAYFYHRLYNPSAPAYDVITPAAAMAQGLLLVEMTDAEHLRAEAFAGTQALTADFTDQARVYAR